MVSSPLPHWFTLFAASAIFSVMLSLGLLLGREQIAAALQRRLVLCAIVFAVVVPVPVLAISFIKFFGLTGPVAAGIVLMSISPGAPVALRRSIEAGGNPHFAPALHLSIVMLSVVTIPSSIEILNAIFDKDFSASPFLIARQVFFAQLLPISIGAAFRAYKPAAAAWLQPRLARFANLMLVLLLLCCVYLLWSMSETIGWMPSIAGVVVTAAALLVGAVFAGRDREARPAAAVATAMRNPGLALVIAAVNRVPSGVTASVFGYSLGAMAVVASYVVLQRRTLRSN